MKKNTSKNAEKQKTLERRKQRQQKEYNRQQAEREVAQK